MPLPKSRIFMLACLAAVLGMGFGHRAAVAAQFSLAMLAVMAVTIGWRSRPAKAFGFALLVFCLSAQFAQSREPAGLSVYYGRKATMEMIVDDDPDIREKSIGFPARVISIDGHQLDSRIAAVLRRWPVYGYGTKLVAEGKLEPETEFNFKDNVAGQAVFPEILSAEPGHGQTWRAWLYALKHSLLGKIGSLLPEPHAGLLAGLLLGTRDMPDELLEQFRTTGTSHIVAVSGFNVTIVSGFLDAALRRFGRKISFYGSVLAIFGFVVITGATASVVRAGIMGSMALAARQAGRMYASVNALVLAAAAMLVGNPKLLEFDIGFQLSFAALAGLLFVQPKISELLPYQNWATAVVYPTLAAQISTTPLILYHFGNFSAISVLTNFLVLPAIPLAMLAGFAALVAGFAWPLLGSAVAMPAWLVLEYVIQSVGWTARVPGASVANLPFPSWAAVLYYVILVALLKWKPKPRTS